MTKPYQPSPTSIAAPTCSLRAGSTNGTHKKCLLGALLLPTGLFYKAEMEASFDYELAEEEKEGARTQKREVIPVVANE